MSPAETLRKAKAARRTTKKSGVLAAQTGPEAAPLAAADLAHEHDERWANGVDWPVVVWIVLVHAGALAAPFYFTWKALGLFAVLSWVTGVGVTLGYHRQLTHGSFSTYRPVRWFLAFLGGLSGEGSALTWVANHRKHHAFSDKEGDPHSPRHGKWWSHRLWFMPNFGRKHHDELTARYAPDLVKDPVYRWLHTLFIPSHLAAGALLFAIGYYGWDTHTAISFVVWGMFVRMVYVLHVTWFVNSATHLWGYRNYETTDDSRNLWWVGLLAFGEGWHNNHHAYQRMAKHGHRWWEFDVTYLHILLLEKLGLAWDVVKKVPPRTRPA
ncbi:MAG TPA: fatty acid desaturase [Pirellulales bacterium]|nr:fatty acid desaturase [Pirellulales bacterium]